MKQPKECIRRKMSDAGKSSNAHKGKMRIGVRLADESIGRCCLMYILICSGPEAEEVRASSQEYSCGLCGGLIATEQFILRAP